MSKYEMSILGISLIDILEAVGITFFKKLDRNSTI